MLLNLCRKARRGLTLIELVVVVAVLTILGSLIVQTLPSMMKRTHLSKCADTIAALNRAWGESFAMSTRYPDGYDSLLASGGSAKFEKLTPGLSSLVTVGTLSATETAAFTSIGITSVFDLTLGSTVTNVTFDSAPLGSTARLLGSGNVATLPVPTGDGSTYWDANPLGLKRHLDPTVTVKYVVFGIGPNCSGVGSGRLLQEAPVHYGADNSISPATTYQRYLAVFSLSTDARGIVTANFEAAAGNDVTGPSSAEAHVRQFYDEQASGRS
jgi:prepilin-type N-terminal cleavage/methylation domain-containing protein